METDPESLKSEAVYLSSSHLCGEKLTHGVVGEVLALGAHVLHAPHVVQHVLPVTPELVQQQGVSDEEGEDDHAHVQELAEAKVEVVLGVSGTEVKEVLGDHSRLSSCPEKISHLKKGKKCYYGNRNVGYLCLNKVSVLLTRPFSRKFLQTLRGNLAKPKQKVRRKGSQR